MLNKKQTPGFFGCLMGFVLGLVVSFAATVAIRGAYNKSADEFNSTMRIDELGIAYRTMFQQEHIPVNDTIPTFSSTDKKVESNATIETCNCIIEKP